MIQGIRVLAIGSELTNGFISDTNVKFIADQMFTLGIELIEASIIPDNSELIKDTLIKFIQKKDIIITTGGLGPTDDDLTVDLLCELTGRETEYDPASLKKVNTLIKRISKKSSSDTLFENVKNRILRQARIPKGAVGLKNSTGLAPGIYIPEISLFSLPGFPVEIKSIWPEVIEQLSRLEIKKKVTASIPLWGIAEATAYESIHTPENIFLGVHALPWGSKLFFKSSEETNNSYIKLKSEIYNLYNDHILDNPINKWIEYLLSNNNKFATVESCTGGLGGKMITDLAGSSRYYNGSITCYDNVIKQNLLRVKKETLAAFGAVSEETALELCINGLDVLSCDYTFSTTGIAGPDGGTLEKPTGTIFIGIAGKKEKLALVGKFFLPYGRERFREAAVHISFLLLYYRFVKYPKYENWKTSFLFPYCKKEIVIQQVDADYKK